MPRNSSGTMSGTNGPYTAGTTISSAAINARFADDEAETTDSLSRSGKGGMLAVLRGIDGTVAAPAYSFTSEVGTGAYRAGATDYRIAVGGVDALKLGPGGLPSGLTLTGVNQPIVVTGTNSGMFLRGNLSATDAGADLVFQSTAVRTAGFLAAFQNTPTGNKLFVDYQGLLSLASQAAAIQPASIWTAITPNANWTAGNGLAYWKDACGIVRIKGYVTTGGGANPAFTLPAGFRPAALRYFHASNVLGDTYVSVSANGDVACTNGAGAVNSSYLDPVSFLAEQ